MGVYWKGALPKITGGYGFACNGTETSPTTMWYAYGAFYQETIASRRVGSSGSSGTSHGLAFDASKSSSIYNREDNAAFPAGLHIKFIIKY